MVKKIEKDTLSKDELYEIDCFINEDNIKELLTLDNKLIINFIEKCEEILGYSLCKNELDCYLSDEVLNAKYFFEEEKIDYYIKILELIEYFSFTDISLYYVMGDYFYSKNKKDEALKLYKKVFKKGFNIGEMNYFNSLQNYLSILDKNVAEELKELIKFSPIDDVYGLSGIDCYLLLIINLEKYSDEYLFYINEGIDIATKVVREYQKNTQNRNYFSDTAEERDLCELITLKMEYYVYKKDYINAFELYKKLTEEISKSDCTRYYHARDKYYRQMLEYMSVDYPELKFLFDIGYYEFKVIGDYKAVKINQEIILQKKDLLTFKFKVVNIYENDITIVPILPIIGEGGRIFTILYVENGNVYLKNKLSH